MQNNMLDYLLGSTSPMGFAGYFSNVVKTDDGWRTVLIKAGPGCGKSTLMKKLADFFHQQGKAVELIHCSSDPQSLDGVICREAKFCILDATAPHTIEPGYPVAAEEILSLYHLIDRSKISLHRDEVVRLFCQCANLHERATRYITAAGSIVLDTMRIANCALNSKKVKEYADRLCLKYFKNQNKNGCEEIRLLSAMTYEGNIFYKETIEKQCTKIVVFKDEGGAAGKAILKQIRDSALAKGYEITVCYCPMAPYDKIEHIIIPSLSLCFTTTYKNHEASFENSKTVNCLRFYNEEILKLRKNRINFNRKAAKELIEQASVIQREAKDTHDKLEVFYKDAIDFDALNKIAEKMFESFKV